MTISNISLMNFRIPNDVRSEFNNVCKLNHTTMSHRIISLIKDDILKLKEDLIVTKNKSKDLDEILGES